MVSHYSIYQILYADLPSCQCQVVVSHLEVLLIHDDCRCFMPVCTDMIAIPAKQIFQFDILHVPKVNIDRIYIGRL